MNTVITVLWVISAIIGVIAIALFGIAIIYNIKAKKYEKIKQTKKNNNVIVNNNDNNYINNNNALNTNKNK